jgi:hypothetical protein
VGTVSDPHEIVDARLDEVERLAQSGTQLCDRCVTDPYLWAAVVDQASPAECDVCGARSIAVTFETLASAIEEVLYTFYVSLEESGAYRDDGEWSETVHDVRDISEDLLLDAVSSAAWQPLVEFVAGRNAIDYGFVRQRDVFGSLYDFDEGDWRLFMRDARDGRFDEAVADLLKSLPVGTLDLFRRIEQLAQQASMFKSATPALWRCRRGSEEKPPKGGIDIGSPPAEYAGDGRLNTQGQSVFYGSTTLYGAVLEVASHTSPDVGLWAGRFTPTRALYHLDVRDSPPLPSRFAPGAKDDWDASTFLRRFSVSVSEPRTGNPRHYGPTQIFVAYLLSAPDELRVDAIRFGSSLDPSVENWVVFTDHEHCGDAHEAPESGELFLLLDGDTTRFVLADDPKLRGDEPS